MILFYQHIIPSSKIVVCGINRIVQDLYNLLIIKNIFASKYQKYVERDKEKLQFVVEQRMYSYCHLWMAFKKNCLASVINRITSDLTRFQNKNEKGA